MPKLYRNKGQYSFSTRYKQNGDSELMPGEQEESSQQIQRLDTDYTSPTRWLSKNLLESSQNEPDSYSKSCISRNMNSGKTMDIH